MDERRLLHVYGQAAWHDDVFIYGNRAALTALREAIDRALAAKDGRAAAEAMTTDGEGFGIGVFHDDSPWESDAWRLALLPYTEDAAKDQREDAVDPASRWHFCKCGHRFIDHKESEVESSTNLNDLLPQNCITEGCGCRIWEPRKVQVE